MEVRGGQDAFFALFEPFGLRQTLTLRAVTIATRIVRRSLMPTLGAHIEMPAEGRSAAPRDRSHRLALLWGHPVGASILVTVDAKYLTDIEPGALYWPVERTGSRTSHARLSEHLAFLGAQGIQRALYPPCQILAHLGVPHRGLH